MSIYNQINLIRKFFHIKNKNKHFFFITRPLFCCLYHFAFIYKRNAVEKRERVDLHIQRVLVMKTTDLDHPFIIPRTYIAVALYTDINNLYMEATTTSSSSEAILNIIVIVQEVRLLPTLPNNDRSTHDTTIYEQD